MNPTLASSMPTTKKRTVRRGRLPNTHYRVREYLTEKEVERLMKAAGDNRYGHRDATMILLSYRHGLRASELCSLRWEQVDLVHGRLHVSRAKSGIPSVHPLTGTELRALRRLQREQEPGRYVFMSERGAPMSPVGFRRMVTAPRGGCEDAFQLASPYARTCLRVQVGEPGRGHSQRCSTISATRTSSTPFVTPSFHPTGSGTSGAIELAPDPRSADLKLA